MIYSFERLLKVEELSLTDLFLNTLKNNEGDK